MYLFLERGEGREIEREKNIDEREKHQWVASHKPQPSPGPQPRHVRQPEIKPVTFQFTGGRPIHWATLIRAILIFKIFYSFTLETGEGREKESERKIKVRNIDWLPFVRVPGENQTCNPGLCPDQEPDWESNRQPFVLQNDAQPVSHTDQGKDILIWRAYFNVNTIYRLCPEGMQQCNKENRDIYWRRYKIQGTLYIRQWCLSSLQTRHLGTSEFSQLSSAALSYFPESHWWSKISSLSKVILVLGKTRSCMVPNLGYRGS